MLDNECRWDSVMSTPHNKKDPNDNPDNASIRTTRQILRFCGRENSKSSSSVTTLDQPDQNPKKWSWKRLKPSCSKSRLIEFVTGRIGGELEPRTIDLKALAQKRGLQKWDDVNVQDQAMLIHEALSSNLQFLIDPTAGYMRMWDIIIIFALFFTCIVTPFEVAFILPLYSEDASCQANTLWIFNRVVDAIFLKDLIMQFFLKVECKSRRGTVLLRDRNLICKKYLRGFFLIDLMSIIPYDIITCHSSQKGLAAMRIVRLFRLMKLARIFRASRLFKRWQDHISLTFATIALAKWSVGILLLSHWMACLWGLCGLEFTLGKPINCQSPDRNRVTDWSGPSWVRDIFRPTAESLHHDDPCNPFSIYLIAWHWSVMTITSIGYGDVVPTQGLEYFFCVLIMFVVSFCWAYVIGCACGVIMSMDPVRVEFEQGMDQLNSMMKDQDVPPLLQRKLRENMREAQNLHRLLRSRELSKDMAPSLKCELIMHTSSQWIRHVSFLRGCSQAFMMELVDSFDVLMYARKEKIVMPYVRLCVVERGAVGRAGKVLVPGSVWGEDVILADRRLQQVSHTTALTFVQLLSLSKEQIEGILKGYPRERRIIRKTACKLALRKAAVLVAKGMNMLKKPNISNLSEMATTGPRLLHIFDGNRSQRNTINSFNDLVRLFSCEGLHTGHTSCIPQPMYAGHTGAQGRYNGVADQREMEGRIRHDLNDIHSKINMMCNAIELIAKSNGGGNQDICTQVGGITSNIASSGIGGIPSEGMPAQEQARGGPNLMPSQEAGIVPSLNAQHSLGLARQNPLGQTGESGQTTAETTGGGGTSASSPCLVQTDQIQIGGLQTGGAKSSTHCVTQRTPQINASKGSACLSVDYSSPPNKEGRHSQITYSREGFGNDDVIAQFNAATLDTVEDEPRSGRKKWQPQKNGPRPGQLRNNGRNKSSPPTLSLYGKNGRSGSAGKSPASRLTGNNTASFGRSNSNLSSIHAERASESVQLSWGAEAYSDESDDNPRDESLRIMPSDNGCSPGTFSLANNRDINSPIHYFSAQKSQSKKSDLKSAQKSSLQKSNPSSCSKDSKDEITKTVSFVEVPSEGPVATMGDLADIPETDAQELPEITEIQGPATKKSGFTSLFNFGSCSNKPSRGASP